MTCTACTKESGLYRSDCEDCKARAIAIGPDAWKAANGESNVPLREAIVKVFPADPKAGRVLVWEWMKRLGVAK